MYKYQSFEFPLSKIPTRFHFKSFKCKKIIHLGSKRSMKLPKQQVFSCVFSFWCLEMSFWDIFMSSFERRCQGESLKRMCQQWPTHRLQQRAVAWRKMFVIIVWTKQPNEENLKNYWKSWQRFWKLNYACALLWTER